MGVSVQQETLTQNEQFLKKAYHRALFPCILSILSGNINILADGILVGQRLGTEALAAINLCVPVYLLLCIVGSFFVSGTAIPAAKAIGAGRLEEAQKFYRTAVSTTLAASVLFTMAGLLLLRPLTVFLSPDPALQPMVFSYAGITLAGALPKIMIYVPFWFLRLEGKNKTVTWMMTMMAGGNIILDLWFLYGLEMGVAGAALASVLATAAACVMGFASLCRRSGSFSVKFFCWFRAEAWKEIVQAGSPSACNNLFQTLRLLVVNSLLFQAGGARMVAAFTAVNCIASFAMCITDGAPQAASAMLGIYHGEHDNNSVRLLLKREWKSGLFCGLLFALAVIGGSEWITAMYGLTDSLRFPMICLGLGLPFGLLCSILSGYYNVSGHNLWANAIIFLRVFFWAAGSLWLLGVFGKNLWWFLPASEMLTVGSWYVATAVFHRRHRELSRFLMMDLSIERAGRVLGFSVDGNVEEICEASQKISGFCEENGLTVKQAMRISLAMEEIMTLIVNINSREKLTFDARAFAIQGVVGIRIRYGGMEYNPFDVKEEAEEMYLGIGMIRSLAEKVLYQKTFGVNTLQILI